MPKPHNLYTDWVSSLSRDDLYSLALLLFQVLTQDFQLMITSASKIVAKYVNRQFRSGGSTSYKTRVNFLIFYVEHKLEWALLQMMKT